MNKEKCIILSYAPIKSNFEFTFWNRFCCLCISFGYSVYYVGPIAFPNSMVNSYIVPRNLEDVYNALSNEILYDIIDRKMVDICYRREKAFMKSDGIKSFLAIHKILTLFRNINLAHDIKAIVAWTRITPASFLIWEYAKKNHIPCFEAERAPFSNFIWIEKTGILNQAKMWKEYTPRVGCCPELGKRVSNELKNNVYGFRTSFRSNCKSFIKRKKVLFCPMDNIYESVWLPQDHPLSCERYPDVPSPDEFLNLLYDMAVSWDYELVIRTHPSCHYIQKEKFPKLKICDDDLAYLLGVSDLVLCGHTKVSYPAVALGKDVITYVKNTVLCAGLGNKINLINCVNEQPAHINKDKYYWERVYNFFGWLASSYFYTTNREGQQIDTFVEEIIQ